MLGFIVGWRIIAKPRFQPRQFWKRALVCSRQRTIHIPRSLQVRMQVMPAGRLFIGMSSAAQHPLT
jgi:hypothetical protein